ncbi:DUF4232 domain-containing protein [Actinomycetospora termitidis]|uniref:DUF4232 domain-containing protein n=1 Tax=Actinomycetospora termitidis TaxID=3053470 RepID=A0ABT7MGB9_9PSEU|nr:DUF4232 domain-containing protein [Actinomycetospora sp. Odt1-22]MDL5159730.1 DUF4232 domain-containing protein [Actinomycetospora sp. Odt1-22]
MSSTSRARVAALALSGAVVAALPAGCSDAPLDVPSPAAASLPVRAPTSSAVQPSSTATPDPDGCDLALLRASVTAPGPAEQPSQRTVRVVWTNTTDRTCTLSGYGHAILQAAPEQEWESGTQYALREQDRAAPSTRLAPNGQAHTTITYLPGGDDTMAGEYVPTALIVTPPGNDELGAAVLAWPGGPVAYQAGATRPGSYFGPVEPGA